MFIKAKEFVKPGDIVYIYHMFGNSEYKDTEGMVKFINEKDQLIGTWGDSPLHFDDDWEIIG